MVERVVAADAAFAAVIDHMSHGLVVVDAEDRLVLCNDKYREFYGLAPDQTVPGMAMREVIGHSLAAGNHPGWQLDQFYALRVERLAARLPVDAEHSIHNGRIIGVFDRPLPGGGTVTVYADVTRRRVAESQIREQNHLFDVALANMSQGLCMFDEQSRLVVHNRRYLELFGLPEGSVYPGLSQSELVHLLAARGCYRGPVSAAAIVATSRQALESRDPAPLLRELADGRVVAASYKAMQNGGWVATFEDVTDRHRSAARIAHMARHDALTDLPNRTFMRELMDEAFGRRTPSPVRVFLLDLDRFKAVNDTFGHFAGDALLKEVATRLRAGLGRRETAVRFGGDEFALLQVGAGHGDPGERAEALVRALSAPYDVAGFRAEIGVSVGVAVLDPGDGDLDQVLRNADLALYRAKAEGRGRFRLFEPHMDAMARTRREMEGDLREALSGDGLELHYQPLIHLATGGVTGFEALARWRHPRHGVVLPGLFIPLAEETGLIGALGEWVLERACRDAVAWPEGIGVAVNLSAAQLRDRSFALRLAATLARAGLRPGRLELEITETVLLDDSDSSLTVLHQLRELGVRIAMDDFGTGFSSLSYLRKFPFDKIKIDRSFVGELPSPEDAAIIRAICGLGQSLGVDTLAEGVETEEQLAWVTREGCTSAQGYLISPPRPLSELGMFLHGTWRAAA